MRKRKLGAIVLAAAFAATSAQAEDYTDVKYGFRVTIPEGWTRTKHADDDQLVATSPDTEITFGFCFVDTVPLPGTEALSQAELDERLTGKFTPSHWRTLFEEFKDAAIVDSGEEPQNGRNTHYAVLTYKQGRKDHKLKTVIHFLPGTSYHLTCIAYLDAYPREEAAFETFFDSFVPISTGLIGGVPQPSTALMSAQTNVRPPNADAILKQVTAAMRRVAQRVALSSRGDRR